MFRLKDGWKAAKLSLRSGESETAMNKKSPAYPFKYGPVKKNKKKVAEKKRLKNALVALFSLAAVFCSWWCLFGVLHLRAAWLFVLFLLSWRGCGWWWCYPESTISPAPPLNHPPSAIASGSFVLTSSIAVACTRLHLFNAASALGHTAYACSAKFHTRNFSVAKAKKGEKEH